MKKIIEKLYTDAINNDLAPNLFADEILFQFGYCLPDDFVSPKIESPSNGETVKVITNRKRIVSARYENFFGSEIWETDYDFEDDEIVLGWKIIL